MMGDFRSPAQGPSVLTKVPSFNPAQSGVTPATSFMAPPAAAQGISAQARERARRQRMAMQTPARTGVMSNPVTPAPSPTSVPNAPVPQMGGTGAAPSAPPVASVPGPAAIPAPVPGPAAVPSPGVPVPGAPLPGMVGGPASLQGRPPVPGAPPILPGVPQVPGADLAAKQRLAMTGGR